MHIVHGKQGRLVSCFSLPKSSTDSFHFPVFGAHCSSLWRRKSLVGCKDILCLIIENREEDVITKLMFMWFPLWEKKVDGSR